MTDPIPPVPDLCWPVDAACLGDTWADYPDAVQERAIALATASLYRLTLNRVGGCPITVRPCPQRAYSPQSAYGYPEVGFGSNSWAPYNWSGTWYNDTGCGPRHCGGIRDIELGTFIGRVDEISVSGDVVDVDSYKVLDNERIVWQGGGEPPWPMTQDFSQPVGADGTWTVTYLPAHPVDELGSWIAGLLAREFAVACCGDSKAKCRLPKGTTAVVRQGVSITVVTGSFPNGKTGIEEVDSWTALWNPKGLLVVPRVYSPDIPMAVRES